MKLGIGNSFVAQGGGGVFPTIFLTLDNGTFLTLDNGTTLLTL